eukprot:1381267-Heterocapsa_arctica.AAC.1
MLSVRRRIRLLSPCCLLHGGLVPLLRDPWRSSCSPWDHLRPEVPRAGRMRKALLPRIPRREWDGAGWPPALLHLRGCPMVQCSRVGLLRMPSHVEVLHLAPFNCLDGVA